MTSILIVEDDTSLCNGIALALQESRRQFSLCTDVSSAKKLIEIQQFDLLILDINLPDGNGLELCRWIRTFSAVPVLFLTVNDTELDMVSGLNIGGDDYITKPFSLAVLRARVNALLRRGNTASGMTRVEIAPFVFDFECMLFTKYGSSIELSKTEQKLLWLLVQNKGQVLTREKLSERIWQDGTDYVDENALSVTIRRLRSKLEDDPGSPKYIKTVYGLGYTWVVDV